MKNTYIQQGSTFRAIDTDAFGIHERLPIGTYTINETPLGFEIAGDQHTCSETKTAYHDTPLYLAPGAKGEEK